MRKPEWLSEADLFGLIDVYQMDKRFSIEQLYLMSVENNDVKTLTWCKTFLEKQNEKTNN